MSRKKAIDDLIRFVLDNSRVGVDGNEDVISLAGYQCGFTRLSRVVHRWWPIEICLIASVVGARDFAILNLLDTLRLTGESDENDVGFYPALGPASRTS